MAISSIGAEVDPFAPAAGPAPEENRAPLPEVEVAEPDQAPLPEGSGTTVDTSA